MKREALFCLLFFLLAILITLGVLGGPRLTSLFVSDDRQQVHLRPAQAVQPRISYAGPFLNVHPDVKYVGSDKCADCHRDVASSYARHPMARTLLPVSGLSGALPYDSAHNDPFGAFDRLFRADDTDGHVRHRQIRKDETGAVIFELVHDVHYALGSGAHGHSFVSNRDGYLFQTPISWFSQQTKWGPSPGFGDPLLPGRPMVHACFFCHANRAFPVEDSINRYEAPVFQELGIGCERCHGPGEKHVRLGGRLSEVTKEAAATSEVLHANVRSVDYTIVNPAKLKPALREAICQQCHLTGASRVLPRGRKLYDFRPGLPLESCWSVFVQARTSGAGTRAVNHVEQMYLSKCFQRTPEPNKLGCISCHDPHVHIGPEQRISHYRSRCLNCHDANRGGRNQVSCSLPLEERLKLSKHDSCIQCHMPRYRASDIVHNASTNHRILRRPTKDDSPDVQAVPDGDLVLFPSGPVSGRDRQHGRDLGIALAELAVHGNAGREQISQALLLLQSTLQPDDLPAWAGKAQLLLLQRRHSEALAALETILDKQPNHELARTLAASITAEPTQAIAHWRAAVALNTWAPQYHANLALLLTGRKDWAEAEVECRAALRLNPAGVGVRKLLVECLLEENRPAEARTEFDRIIALKPDNVRQLQEWFAKKVK